MNRKSDDRREEGNGQRDRGRHERIETREDV